LIDYGLKEKRSLNLFLLRSEKEPEEIRPEEKPGSRYQFLIKFIGNRKNKGFPNPRAFPHST